MEPLISIISGILLLIVISAPILIFMGVLKFQPGKYTFWKFLFWGMIFTICISFLFAWWSSYSDQLLLSHYGYNHDAMNETERYGAITKENLDKVKKIELGYSGIGWPLKAIMICMIFFPYLIIVYLIGHLLKMAISNQEEKDKMP